MHNYVDEIPVRAYLNANIIDKAVTLPEFEKCVNEIMSKAGIPGAPYQFKNPAYIIGLLYCLIVVPQQKWLDDPEDPIYTRPPILELNRYFNFIINDCNWTGHPSYQLIRHLRNAISHVRRGGPPFMVGSRVLNLSLILRLTSKLSTFIVPYASSSSL